MGANDDDTVVDAEIVDSDNLPAVIQRDTYQTTKPIGVEAEPQGRDWPQGPTPERRCRAHKKTGERCKNAALQGATVCRFHGGAARHVKAAARARLENAADLMARNLLRLAVEAQSETVNLGATNSALDRVGIVRPQEIVLSQGDAKPWEEVFEDISSETREESRARRGYDPQSSPASAYADMPPEYQYRSDPAAAEDNSVSERDAPLGEPAPQAVGRQRHAQPPSRHVSGGDALHVAAELTRERLALESQHKRYRAHRR